MLYSNTQKITVTLSLCNTKHQQYVYVQPVALWNISGKKATEMRILVALYISVRPSSYNINALLRI